MIYTTDQILINGSNNIYNGYIYNLDYQPSFGQNPSYCTLNLISEDGTYSITSGDLQVLVPDSIQIGTGISLSMYPVEYDKSLTPQGRTLQIKYIDTSIILDKRLVVLNGRQGNDGTAFPINPLPSASGSGSLSSFTYTNDKFVGSCYIPLGSGLLKLGENPFNTVLQVVYTFPDLCEGITANGIVIAQDSLNLIANSSQYYAASYIGSLRTVLANWCKDLGYGFYWENNQLHFIDLTTPLVLNTSQYDNMVQEAQSERVSIEDTIGQVAVAFYKQDFSKDTIPFSQKTSITFNVITLAQIGLSSDEVTSVTAAFCGYPVFYGHHFLYGGGGSNYAKGILGFSGNYTQAIGGDAATVDGLLLDDDADGNPFFDSYWFVPQLKVDVTQPNYQAYLNVANQVGKYYYKPMTKGDFRNITSQTYKMDFYPGTGVMAQCPGLQQLAAYIGDANITLDQFLIGGSATFSNDSNPNISAYSVASPASETQTVELDDNTAGYALITLDNPAWYYNGNPVTQAQVQEINTSAGLGDYLPFERPSNEPTIKTVLTAFNADLYSTVEADGDLQWNLSSAVSFNSYGPLTFSLVSPEFDPLNPTNPRSLINDVTIDTPYAQIIPKIEEFFRSNTDKEGNTVDCHSNVIKMDLNYSEINNADLTALGNPIVGRFVSNVWGIAIPYPAAPNPANLDAAFIDFTKNLTLSKTDPTIVKTYTFPYINFPQNEAISLGNGLMSLSIRVDEKGVSSTYTIGTRLMQLPSIEVIRANLSFQNKTNESRYLPYGYSQGITYP